MASRPAAGRVVAVGSSEPFAGFDHSARFGLAPGHGASTRSSGTSPPARPQLSPSAKGGAPRSLACGHGIQAPSRTRRISGVGCGKSDGGDGGGVLRECGTRTRSLKSRAQFDPATLRRNGRNSASFSRAIDYTYPYLTFLLRTFGLLNIQKGGQNCLFKDYHTLGHR